LNKDANLSSVLSLGPTKTRRKEANDKVRKDSVSYSKMGVHVQ
jgi:hypothetical protein